MSEYMYENRRTMLLTDYDGEGNLRPTTRSQTTKPKASNEASSEPKSSETSPVQPKRERRSYAMPSMVIYRPPAARRLEEQSSSNQEREPINSSINGKHDCKCPSELDDSGQTPKKTDSSGISMFRNAISSIRNQNQVPKCKSEDPAKKTESRVKSTVNTTKVRLRRPDMKVYVPKARRILIDQEKPSKEDSVAENEVSSVKHNEKPKNTSVQGDSSTTSEQTKKPVMDDVNSGKNGELPKKPVQNDINSAKNNEHQKKPVQNDINSAKNKEHPKKPVHRDVTSAKNRGKPKRSSAKSDTNIAKSDQPKKLLLQSHSNCAKSDQPKKLLQSDTSSAKNSEKLKKPNVQNDVNDIKDVELQRKPVENEFYGAKHSEEPKKKRERTEILDSDKMQCESSSVCSKHTSYSDYRTVKFEAKPVYPVSPSSLWIESQNEVEEVVKKVSSLVPVEKSCNSGPDPSKSSVEEIYGERTMKGDTFQLNPEECDWEAMFDDSGECLDPSLMEQLSSAVGAVTIEKPKSNYDSFRTKSLDLGDEFPHVIEIYNFPPEFCHQDLVVVFSQFKNAGFEIKWVDDTHALGIFSSAQIVSEVLAIRHPFVKTRLLRDGTMLSKAKARRFAEHLLPYKPRPDTCTALARRLVTGALGVRLPTSREEREAERKILSEARERKRQEARQREEAWEGNFH